MWQPFSASADRETTVTAQDQNEVMRMSSTQEKMALWHFLMYFEFVLVTCYSAMNSALWKLNQKTCYLFS